MRGEHCRGPPLQVGELTPESILPWFETRKLILKALAHLRVRSLGWAGTRWLLEVDEPDEFTKLSLPRLINGPVFRIADPSGADVLNGPCFGPVQEGLRNHGPFGGQTMSVQRT